MGKNTYRYIELSSCVKGELFKYTFKGNNTQYVALLTESQFEEYKKDFNNVNRFSVISPVVLTSKTDDEKLVIVRDLDGAEMPTEWGGSVSLYSPLISKSNIDKGPSILKYRVKNAKDTDTDESMIQYWKDNKKRASIDLTKKTCQCPSCGKTVKTSEMDGAHVVKVNNTDGKESITPTCQTCNRSKVDRVFEVGAFDLVEAPVD